MSEASGMPSGDDVTVRPLRPADLGFIRSLAQDGRVTRFVGDGTPWTDAYVQRRFDDALADADAVAGSVDREVRWFIAENAAGSELGLLALTLLPTETEVGYWIAPNSWGRGYATRLVEHAIRVAQSERPGVPLVATVHQDNVASRRVLERSGFVPDDAAATGQSTDRAFRFISPAGIPG
jgi:ribosomal-protein-alanine N-acetyltransferase